MVSRDAAIPDWAFEVLACPRCGGSLERAAEDLCCGHCGVVGRVDRGVACFEVDTREEAVAFYEAVQGPLVCEQLRAAPLAAAVRQQLQPHPEGGARAPCRVLP